jgi:PAS domain S-box-containing protein
VTFLRIAGLAVAYYFACVLGLRYLPPVGDAYALWIAPGLALAAALVWGWPMAIGVGLGALAFRLGPGGANLGASAAIALVRALETCAAAELISRVGSGKLPREARQVFLAITATCFIALMGRAAGTTIVCLGGREAWTSFAMVMGKWWLSDVCGMLLIAPLAATIHGRRKRSRTQHSVRDFLWPLASFIMSASFFAFFGIDSLTRERAFGEFREESEEIVRVLRNRMAESLGSVNAVGAFYEASTEVEAGEFASFVSRIMANDPSILRMTWNPRPDRGGSGPGSGSLPVPADFPVAFQLSSPGIEPGLLDGTGADRAVSAAIDAACKSGETALTAPFSLRGASGTRTAIVLVVPVFRKGLPLETVKDRRSALGGVATGVCAMDDWMRKAIVDLDPHDIESYVYDVTDADAPLPLAFHSLRSGDGRVGITGLPALSALLKEEHYSLSWKVGGREWLYLGRPGASFDAIVRDWSSLFLILIGLAVTVSMMIYASSRQKAEEALARSESDFRSLADDSVAGIVKADREGRILYANAAAARAFGYPGWAAFKAAGFRQHIVENDRYKAARAELAGTGSASSYDIEIAAASGVRRHLLVSSTMSGEVLVCTFMDVTDRDSRNRELLRLSGVVDQMADSVIITDREGRIEYVNPAFEQLTGYSQDEVMGKSPDFLESGVQDEEFYRGLWATILAGKVFRAELVNRKKNGDLYTESKTISPIKGEDGSIISFVATGKDITERMRSEALRETVYRIAQAARSAAGLDDLYAEIHRLISRHVPARNFLIALLDLRINRLRFAYVVDEKDSYEKGDLLPGVNGLSEYVLRSGNPLLYTPGPESGEHGQAFGSPFRVWLGVPLVAHGETIGVMALHDYDREDAYSELDLRMMEFVSSQVAAAIDIGRSEEAVRLVELRNRAIIANAPDGILLFDADGAVVFASPSACRLLGREASDLAGSRLSDAMHPEDRDRLGGQFSALVADASRGFTAEYRCLRGDDGYRWIEGSFANLLGQAGVQAIVNNFRDVTAAKTAQRELEELNATLEQRVAKRTEELRVSHKKLVAANNELERAMRMKDEFLANISHEIRTPMNAIIGLSSLALRTDMTDKQRDYVSKVHNAGISLLGVINDILDFSKIEAGKLSLETVDFSLDDVLANLGTLVSQKVAEKKLEFVIECQRDMPRDWSGDPLRLGQILLNLVSNAVKFTSKGEVELSVSLAERLGSKAKLLFAVRDTGIGIDAKKLPGLFQAFMQADSSTTRKYGGTGLGLNISKKLVELMGGQIWAESESGKGSTFRFTIWLDEGKGETQRGAGVPEAASGMRVLVVDDNPTAREVQKDIMTELRFRVETASTGEEALDLVRREDVSDPFGLVLMDLNMPGGADGLEATRRMKQAGLRNEPRVFIVTGSAGEEERASAEASGAVDYLLKPLTNAAVASAVWKHFREEERLPSEALPAASVDGGRDVLVPPDLSGLRILLAEDNEINRQIATELLEARGVQVSTAVDGREAARAVTESGQTFDVVLMDIQMPEMDGYDSARLIRADGRFAELPIIAMTAYAMDRDRKRVREAGMNGHVSKPIDPDALYETIAAFTRRLPAAPRPVSPDAPSSVAPSPAVVSPAVSASGESPAPLPGLVLVDVADGLSRVAGNRRLYGELLGRFAAGQAEAARQAAAALGSGDRQLAERLVHGLKGLSGNIGAKELFRAAAAAEEALRQGAGDGGLDGLIDALGKSLDGVVAEIRTALDPGTLPVPDGSPPPAGPEAAAKAGEGTVAAAAPDEDRLTRILSRLGALVADSDTEALDFLGGSRADLLAGLGPDRVAALEGALAVYDFAAAARVLSGGGDRG